MFKLLFWIGLGYIAYRYFSKPKQIAEKRDEHFQNKKNTNHHNNQRNDDDYIDYEEVD